MVDDIRTQGAAGAEACGIVGLEINSPDYPAKPMRGRID
jgi:hypothetical protein